MRRLLRITAWTTPRARSVEQAATSLDARGVVHAVKPNTVQLVTTMVSVKRFVSLGGSLCLGRFLGHLDILRWMTRGLMRLRRGGICSRCSSQISAVYQRAND